MQELAYIWVSKFRNIENQGFNISSRYLFKYDPEANYLDVQENPQYISNFFGDEVSNVTGIVGQNAAGKTNLLELINYALDGGNTRIAKPFFIILLGSKEFTGYFYQMDEIPQSSVALNKEIYSKGTLPINSIFFSNTYDGRRYNFGKKILDISVNRLMQNQFGINFLNKQKEDFENQIRFIRSNDFAILTKVEKQADPIGYLGLIPTHIKITSPTWSNILQRVDNFDRNINYLFSDSEENERYEQPYSLTKFCQHFRALFTKKISKNSIYYFTAFILFIDFVINDFAPIPGEESISSKIVGRNKQIQKYKDNPSLRPKLLSELNSLQIRQLTDLDLPEIHNRITSEISTLIDREYPYLDERARFMLELGLFEENMVETQYEGTYSSRKISFHSPFNQEIQSFINGYFRSKPNSAIAYHFEWQGISSGHQAYLNMFSRFYSVKEKITPSLLTVITIDEGDLYFHPKWQVEYLYKLLKVLPKILGNDNIQLILTTHSPFLISDLPKSNLIFLEKDNDGFCRVIPSEKIEGETFGGNIGELYLDAFFLKGGLISEFAALKIKNLIQKIQEKGEITREDRILVDLIGEQIISSQLKRMIDGTNR